MTGLDTPAPPLFVAQPCGAVLASAQQIPDAPTLGSDSNSHAADCAQQGAGSLCLTEDASAAGSEQWLLLVKQECKLDCSHQSPLLISKQLMVKGRLLKAVAEELGK